MSVPAINLMNNFNARMMASRARMPHRLPTLARIRLAHRSEDCFRRLQERGYEISLSAVVLSARRLLYLTKAYPSHGARLALAYWKMLELILDGAEKSGWVKEYCDSRVIKLTLWLAKAENLLSRGVTPDNMFALAEAHFAKDANYKEDIPIIFNEFSEPERSLIPAIIAETRRIIAGVSPQQASDISNYISGIAVGPGGSYNIGGLYVEGFNDIRLYMDLEEHSLVSIANFLVHETAHVKFGLGYSYLLIFGFFHRGDISRRGRQELDDMKVLSPGAVDLQIPLTVFTEIYAYLATFQFCSVLLRCSQAEGDSQYLSTIENYRNLYAQILRSLLRIAKEDLTLTELGRVFLERQRSQFYDIFSE